MQTCLRRSTLELRGARKDLRVGSKLHPKLPRPGGSASFRALSPMVTTKRAGGRARTASRR
eukprot:3491392-Alexandrium_andersonii.AAC.1